MAKPIVVNFGGEELSFSFEKLDRARLYGRIRRIVLGPDDEPCQRAQLLEDGSLLLRSGMSSQGYFDDDGNAVKQSDFVGFDSDDNIVDRQPSTLGVAQDLEGPVTPEEVLDLELTTIYHVSPDEVVGALDDSLSKGDIYRFPLNYYADFRTETAFILKNDDGYFVLVGVPTDPSWSEPKVISGEVFESSDADGDDDLDFEMF